MEKELARFRINHYVTVLMLGSDRIKDKFYQNPMLLQSKYMSNLDVRIIKHQKSVINLWNVKPGITNENRLFQSNSDIAIVIVNLDKKYEYFEKALIQRTLVAKGSKLIVCGVHQNDERVSTRKNIVRLCKFCMTNDVDCMILSEDDIGKLLDKLIEEIEQIRQSRKKHVNESYRQWRNSC